MRDRGRSRERDLIARYGRGPGTEQVTNPTIIDALIPRPELAGMFRFHGVGR